MMGGPPSEQRPISVRAKNGRLCGAQNASVLSRRGPKLRLLTIRLLGVPSIAVAGAPLPFKAPVRALTLLAYIAVSREAVLRKRAAFALWPDHDEEAALANLRRHVALVEGALPPATDGEPWILKDRTSLQWCSDGRSFVDAARFEALSDDPQSHPEAVELYRGEFLEGLTDGEWVSAHRDRLHERQMAMLSSLTERYRAAGDVSSALRYAEDALRLDPWREDLMRESMLLRRDLGDAAGALVEYRRFRERLKTELDVEPAPETAATAEEIAAPAHRVVPATRSAPARANNLPRQLGEFVGRAALTDEVVASLAEAPLVTLAGTGGVGKTRLAVTVAAQMLEAMPDGAWFVDLAPLVDPTLVAHAIAAALGLIEVKGVAMLATIEQYARARKLLIVLDNCEHVIGEAARVVASLLQECPDVRVLATSRESLNVGGERLHHVPPLAVPPGDASVTAAEVAAYDAATLFADRARASDARFRLTDDNAAQVADICRQLDGLPLAIELAAARVRALGLRAVLDRLTERLTILSGGVRVAQPRQQTMHALIDWSHELLTERERVVFRRLAIFVGGWSLDAACVVCADERLGAGDIVDLLAALVGKSLVVAEDGGDAQRYRFLESTRAFALGQLEADGERPAVARRHLAYCADLAARFDAAWLTSSDDACFALIAADVDNVRSALAWGIAEGNAVTEGAVLAARCERLWTITGFLEGRRWLGASLNALDANGNPDVAALVLGALFQLLPDGSERLELGERAIAALRAAKNDVCLARVLSAHGHLIGQLGRTDEAVNAIEEAVAIARRNGDRRDLGNALALLAVQRQRQGDLGEAHALLSAALALQEAVGSRSGQGYFLYLLAELDFSRGDVATALDTASQARDILRTLPSEVRVLGVNCANMAAYAIATDEFDAALAFAQEALVHLRGMDDLGVLPLEHIAVVEGLRGRAASAARLLGFTDAMVRRLGMQRGPTESAGYERLRQILAEHDHGGELQRRLLQGAQMTHQEAVALAAPESVARLRRAW
jgi:predicted ATPase/DNA-binding SARP family transcriptional activator